MRALTPLMAMTAMELAQWTSTNVESVAALAPEPLLTIAKKRFGWTMVSAMTATTIADVGGMEVTAVVTQNHLRTVPIAIAWTPTTCATNAAF